jgi:DHA1 family bicyclomycin/chloramphenicol resistance-like MFS transporter
MVIGRAAVGDLYDRARAASMMGYVAMGYGLSPMVGPVIGGLIDEWFGWRASFMFLVGIGVVVAVAAWRVLPETVRATAAGKTGPTFVGAIAELAKLPAFWAVAMTNALSSGAYFTLLGGGSFVSETLLGLTPAAYGAYFILVAAGYVGGNWFTGRFVGRFGPMPLVRAGGLIILVAVLAIAVAAITGNLNAVTFFVPTLFIGFANGLTTPNCATIVIAMRPRLAGTAAGTTAGIHIGFGAVVATFLGVWIGFDPTARPLVIQMVSIALLTMVAIYLSERLLRRQN